MRQNKLDKKNIEKINKFSHSHQNITTKPDKTRTKHSNKLTLTPIEELGIVLSALDDVGLIPVRDELGALSTVFASGGGAGVGARAGSTVKSSFGIKTMSSA
jgi:hypothetical protein